MIYDYVWEMLTTLFLDPEGLTSELILFYEIFAIFISAMIFRLMLSPIFYLFRIAAAQYRAIMPKEKIRSRNFKD